MTYQKINNLVTKGKPQAKSPKGLPDEDIQLLGSIAKIILVVVAGAGMVTLAVVAPNIFSAVGKLYKLKGRSITESEKETKIAQSFYYLKRSGLIKMKPDHAGLKLFLSKLGKKRVSALDFDALHIKKQPRWDGKWWQVAADIPTKNTGKERTF